MRTKIRAFVAFGHGLTSAKNPSPISRPTIWLHDHRTPSRDTDTASITSAPTLPSRFESSPMTGIAVDASPSEYLEIALASNPPPSLERAHAADTI